ncbi:hypothetical protein GEMRC1_008589 [Eukaryota sp. GEM-RC1]
MDDSCHSSLSDLDLDDFVDAVEDENPRPFIPSGTPVNVSTNQRMNLCDFSNLIQRQRFSVTSTPIWTLRFGPDTSNPTLLACAGGDNVIYIYQILNALPKSSQPPSNDVLSPTPVVTLQGHTRPVISMHWRHDGLLISGSADKTARVWYIPPDDPSSAPPRPVAVLDHKEVVTSVVLPSIPHLSKRCHLLLLCHHWFS